MNKKYDFMKGTALLFLLTLFISIVYNLFHIVPSYFMMSLIDAANGHDMHKIMLLVVQSLIFLTVFLSFGIIRGKCMNTYKRKVMFNYKKNYVENILSMKYNDFMKNDNGRYISNLTNNAQIIADGYVEGRINTARALTRSVTIVIIMFVMNWRLFLITVVCVLPSILLGVVSNKLIVNATRKLSDSNSRTVMSIKDVLAGFGVIKSFNAEKEVCDSFGKVLYGLESNNGKLRQYEIYSYVFSDSTSLLMILAVFGVGALFSTKGLITIGELVAFVQLLSTIQSSLEMLPGYIAKMNSGKKLIDDDYIAVETDRADLINVNEIRKNIEVRDLSFAYDGVNNVLKDIDLNLEKSKLYAVVGASGSGKSTLASMLSGNYSDYKGDIIIDEKELRSIGNIYDILTVINQSVFVFNDTIYNNISMFKEFTDEEMNRAVEIAGLSELIREKGMDYQCGESGSNLSGGEKQRISIARSLLLKKSFMIMDESTSNLDIKTARAIENTVLGLKDTLRLVITHNLNDTFLRKCDDIFVIKNGTIVEHGRFDDLIDKKQVFSSMYELWK